MASTAQSDPVPPIVPDSWDYNFDITGRQLRRQGSGLSPSMTSTYDYWWPYPPNNIPASTAAITPVQSPVPILISIISDSSSLTQFMQPSSSSINTSPVSPSVPSKTSSTFKPSSTSGSTADLTTSTKPFKLIDLVPGFAVVGVFLLGLGLWVLYGCFTRKPRVRIDDGELVSGPPYIGLSGSHARRDVEELGHEGMVPAHNYGRRGISGQLRWPSFNQPPAFDKAAEFYVPPEYNHNDDPFLSVSLVAPGGNTRTKSFSTKSISKSMRPRSTQGELSRRASNSTSIALLDLYETDEEEMQRRKEETPWESLRHTSIKRGILEQVKKESTWMNSLRSSFAEGSALLSGRGYKNIPEELTGKDDLAGRMLQGHSRVKRSRRHTRADSDLYAEHATMMYPEAIPLSSTSGSGSSTRRTKDDIIDRMPTPRGRRTLSKLKDEESRDKYPPRPARLSESRSPSRSRSRSRSQSTSPMKRRSIRADQKARAQANVGPRKFLPQSPPQLMSPPLESQMCFTPMPHLPTQIPSAKDPKKPLSRSSTRATPTKIPSAAKGKGKQPSPSPPPLPNLKSPRMDPSRTHLAKKVTAGSANSRNKKMPTYPSPPSAHAGVTSPNKTQRSVSSEDAIRERQPEDAMRKLDHIMEIGWSERDLGREGMRSLSPSGFGRRI